jgi:glucose-6-phosphate isomerase
MTARVESASLSGTAWARLSAHRDATRARSLRERFLSDPGRFAALSFRHGDLLVDLSKCQLEVETIALLAELARATGVEMQRDRMFCGERINATERRPVLHVALRAAHDKQLMVDGHNVIDDVAATAARLVAFADGVRCGTVATSGGAHFTDVVNIGIGGSDLGPAMVTAALRPFASGPRVHFVSNIDGSHLADTMAVLDPARTLFLIASKTFTTIETMTNARTARAWIVEALGEAAVAHHFAALSAAVPKAEAFGIPAGRVFGFWDWVGGRYSVWSAIGLPVMISIGPAAFGAFLAGARDMDQHFCSAPPDRNLPMLLGLLNVWQRAVCGYPTRAILPYDQRLQRLPAFLQQLEMESNGKRVTIDGAAVAVPTGGIVWGAAGTDAQHSFFQLLHQGTDVVPCEFLIAANGFEPDLAHHHDLLMANCLAQSEALALGRTEAEAEALMIAQGIAPAEARRLSPHRTFPGDRPSVTIAYERLDPFTLGRLLALFEHRVFVEAAVHGINAFDQWGVELGKELASGLLPLVQGKPSAGADRNASTRGLVGFLRAAQKPAG